MADQAGVWGIDVGQCALKALRLELEDGKVVATAFDYVEYPKILSQPDADPEQLVREALDTFLSRNEIKGDQVAIGVPGTSGLARFVKLPPVEEKKINDIVRFEAKQQIPFPLDEVVWDYQKIGQGSVTDGFAMETEIGLFAMKRDMVSRFLGHFKAVNVEVHVVQMAPLALVNYVTFDLLKKGGPEATQGKEEGADDTPRGKRRCAVALDIGTDSSSLVITDGEKVIWQRPIPLGGNHFTKALSKDLKLTFAKAEHLKRNAAKAPNLAAILKALKPILTDFVNEVQRSLGYFTNTHRDSHVAYMVGLGSAFRLPGFQKFLSEKLSLEVRKPAKFERVEGDAVVSAPAFTENLLTFPVAYGLALQGLGAGRLTTNLLPPEIVVERKIRAKKPWAAAAAAMLLAGTAVLTVGYAAVYSSVTDERIKKASEEGTRALEAAQRQNTDIQTRETDIQNTQKDVKTIIAGQDEKLNWIKLNEFINRNLPRPGPEGNLLLAGPPPRPNQRQFWQSQQGQRAL
ncbi:MAG TPA: type IV pilus assembly protein PilM, partial [Gemmataceae bacterium]